MSDTATTSPPNDSSTTDHELPHVDAETFRSFVFKNRGALLAVPAVALALVGKPTALSNAIGIPLAFIGEFVRCWAVGYSGETTRKDIVEAPHLATNGPYAYVRNPLYLGNAITGLGFAIAFSGGYPRLAQKAMSLATLGIMAGVYSVIVPHEEEYLNKTFGDEFALYSERVGRVFPRTTPFAQAKGDFDPAVIGKAESRTFLTFGIMLAALAFKSRPKAA